MPISPIGARPYLPGRTAHPANTPVSRRRAAGRCSGTDPAELPGPARNDSPISGLRWRPTGLGVQRLQGLCPNTAATRFWRPGRRLQDYAESKMRAGIAPFPTEPIVSPTATTARRSMENSIWSCEITVAGRCDAPAFRRPAPGSRRAQHDDDRTAFHRLLRRQGHCRSDHSAQRRPRPPAHRHRASWHRSSTAPIPPR